MMSGVCLVWFSLGRFIFGASHEFLLVRFYEFLYLGCWVAATEPLGDGRQERVFVVRRHSLIG